MIKKIDVIGCKYEITETDFNGDDVNGMCVGEFGKILLKKGLCPDKQKQTLIHELLHAIENSNNAVDDLSEIQIELLATGLFSFIKSNKAAIKWLGGDK